MKTFVFGFLNKLKIIEIKTEGNSLGSQANIPKNIKIKICLKFYFLIINV